MRIINSVQVPEFDLKGVSIDLTRKTGVLIRQSKKGADLDSRESRMKQESLVPVAIKLRGDSGSENIILYDEGSGVSGTKGYSERPELTRLYQDIANDVIGSIVVARADRLFRDKHQTYASMFTMLAEKKRILLIVPGRSVYDFSKIGDLQAFQREMQEAYSYLATQVAYMHDTRRQKIQRGLYGGGNIPAPYVIDRSMWKDQQVPVIYKPWQPIAVELFERFRDFDFSLSRMVNYIETLPYVFPYLTPDDAQRYMFKTRMRSVSGGYTFSSAMSIRYYLSNLTLGGYAKIATESNDPTYLANAHEPAIPMDLLSASYAAITGRYPDGTPFRTKSFRSPTVSSVETPAILHGMLKSDNGAVSYLSHKRDNRPRYACYKGDGWANKTGIMHQQKMWSIPCRELDEIIIQRLCDLAQYDVDMADRIKAAWERRKSDSQDEAQSLKIQIERADAQIVRLDKLLTDPAVPLSPDTERRYLSKLQEAETHRAQLRAKQARQQQDLVDVIPNFHFVLSHLVMEYKSLSLEGQKRLARQVIQEIKLNIISPHVLLLHVTWQTGIAACPDVALIWRGSSSNVAEDWTDEEDEIVRRLYPKSSQLEIMEAFPNRAWSRICNRGHDLGIKRQVRHAGPHRFNRFHRTLCFNDLDAIAHLVDGEEERLRDVVDRLARHTERGELTAHWWLSLEQVSLAESTGDEDKLFLTSVAYGSRHRV